ncbi:class I SAM-dependent methyltransferase [Stenotrophomonas muris]|uniref:class I SAM-dependent methyltransferase n=1 Tax=Stenotrophomonas muris TaxID=2963283 RepID=UPI00383BCC3E
MNCNNEDGCSSCYVFEGRIPVWIGGEGEPPEVKEFSGVPYYRFMNKFYVSNKELDRLSMDEVIRLCRARDKYSSSIDTPNGRVKQVFRAVTMNLSPRVVVEIGAGSRPLYRAEETPFRYVVLDADLEALATCEGSKAEFSNEIFRIDASDRSIDLILAVFVFQFEIYRSQIEEVARILSDDGVLLVNIYRRSQESRRGLEALFRESGLIVNALVDPEGLCKDHEYWVVSKIAETGGRVINILIEVIGQH